MLPLDGLDYYASWQFLTQKDDFMRRLLALYCFLATCVPASAHEYVTFDEMGAAFGWDLANTEIRVETVAPVIHVMFGVGGNVLASIGDQGVLMVDSQFPEMIPRLKDKIGELGGGEIDFTINTHWHFDHANGNPALARDGAWMVSQANSRRMMASSQAVDLVDFIYEQPPFPDAAKPIITFTERMQFHFNGDTIDLVHFGPAHTTGDTAILFRNSNVVHLGDVFNAGYPFIDAGNGGDLDGMIEFCEGVLDLINQETIVIPGHGPVLGYTDLADYILMLATVRQRIDTMIDQGKTLEQVIAANPTAEFDAKFGQPGRFIDRAYTSLSR
jgi:cyclase